MRLIDADALIETNKSIIDCEIDHPKYQDTVREIINSAPTIDIVRCRECKHRDKMMPFCLLFKFVTEDDGYCYKGEREDE